MVVRSKYMHEFLRSDVQRIPKADAMHIYHHFILQNCADVRQQNNRNRATQAGIAHHPARSQIHDCAQNCEDGWREYAREHAEFFIITALLFFWQKFSPCFLVKGGCHKEDYIVLEEL